MARVPAVATITKDTAPPEDRDIDVDAGVLDVDAEVPDDYDWDALPDDDDEPVPYSDDDKQPDPPQAAEEPPQEQSRRRPPRDASPQEGSIPNGHTSPPSRDPYASRDSLPKNTSPQEGKPRSDGVVADPMGMDSLEEGEIDQRWMKKRKKKKRSTDSQKLHCDVCGISVTGRIPMDAHLRGQRHIINAKQAALKERNQKISEHSKAILSQNQPPRGPEQSKVEWNSTNTPPKPVRPSSAVPSENQGTEPDQTEKKAKARDPYAPRDVGRPFESSSPDNHVPTSDDPQNTSRNPRSKDSIPNTEHREDGEKEKVTPSHGLKASNPYASRDPYASKGPYTSKGPYATKRNPYASGDLQASRDPYKTRDPFAARDVVKPRQPFPTGDPKATRDAPVLMDTAVPNKDAEANANRPTNGSSRQQNGARETHPDSGDPRKRKHPDNSEDRRSVNGERNSPDEGVEREYKSTSDGALRRKLSDSSRDPRLRGPHTKSTTPQSRLPPSQPTMNSHTPSNEQAVETQQTSEPTKPRLPSLISAPAPSLAAAPTERRDDRRPPDQTTRRFTYGSVNRESSDVLIPSEWLAQPMNTNEWRDLRTNIFEKGDDIDKLSFKMLQEILLSPVLGVSTSCLAPFSRAMLESVKNQHLTPENDTYARFCDLPKPLTIRDENFAKGDPEWQKSQTEEDLAVKLVGDNIIFCLSPYEDNEAAQATEWHNFPKRGSFGQKNMVKSSRDGGVMPRYEDSVDQDPLFNELFEHNFYRSYPR